MKVLHNYIVSVLVLLAAGSVHAQEKESFKLDSASLKRMNQFRSKGDTVKLGIISKLDSTGRIKSLPQPRRDSIANKLTAIENKINLVRKNLTAQTDSMKSVDKPDTLQIKKYLALQQELDSISNNLPSLDIADNAKAKMDSIHQKVNSGLGKINDRVGEISNGMAKAPGMTIPQVNNAPRLPSVDVSDLKLPAMKEPLGTINAPNLKASGLGPNLPDSKLPTNHLPDIDLPNTNVQRSIPKMPSTGNAAELIKDAKEVTEDVQGISKKSGSIRNEITAAKANGLDGTKISGELDNKVGDLDQVKAAQRELGINPATKWNDPEVAKEMLFNKSKEQAMNHFAGHEKELMAAIDQFAAIRSEIKPPEGTMDMLKKRQNTMKGKELIDRLVSGFSLQIQKPNSFWFDLNPYLGYKLSDKFVVHVGWNYRLAIQAGEGMIREERVYGPRTGLDFTWREFFAFTAIIETMNSPVKPISSLPGYEPGKRAWIWSYMIGTKVSYNISKRIKGNAQVLYNLYDPHHQSPYGDRLVMRMGMEFKLKRNKSKTAVKSGISDKPLKTDN